MIGENSFKKLEKLERTTLEQNFKKVGKFRKKTQNVEKIQLKKVTNWNRNSPKILSITISNRGF